MRFYSCYAFDLDGTLYRGSEVVSGAQATVSELESRGARVLYVTNNSGLMRKDYVAKLASFGFQSEPEHIITSGVVAARHCVSKDITKVFIVGEPGLVGTFRELGVEVINADKDGNVGTTGDGAQALVSGICRAALSYKLLDAAMQVAINTKTYIACNKDLTYPVEEGKFCPGSGAIVAAIEGCSGLKALNVGKPEPAILLDALRDIGVDPADTLMVGDRMDTDIECGKAAGTDTCLVLSGVTQTAVPNQWCVNSIKDLV